MRRVPGASHNYDGLQFSRITRTVFFANNGAADGSCIEAAAGEYAGDERILGRHPKAIFEFNPDRTETRNGIAPLTWRRHAIAEDVDIRSPRSLELPDGSMLIGSRKRLYTFDPLSGTVGQQVWRVRTDITGMAEYHPSGMLLSLAEALRVMSLDNPFTDTIASPDGLGMSIEPDQRGLVFSWDGTDKIYTIDLAAGARAWVLYDWSDAGPPAGDRRVYSKWQYVTAHDVFVGLSTHETGVWIYKHPKDMPGRVVAAD